MKKIMMKTITLVKRAVKWYLKQVNPYTPYVCGPSGMIPYNYMISEKEKQ